MANPKTKPARRKPAPKPATSTGNTNSSYLGSLVRVDPADAAARILKAHRDSEGNSTQAAGALGVTYPHLLTLISRLSKPIVDPKQGGEVCTIKLPPKRGGEAVTLREAITALRGGADSTAGEDETIAPEVLRELLDKAVLGGARLAHIAEAVKLGEGKTLELSLLSKFRHEKRTLSADVRKKLRKVLDGLAAKPAEPTQGRRATPRPAKPRREART